MIYKDEQVYPQSYGHQYNRKIQAAYTEITINIQTNGGWCNNYCNPNG